MKISLLSGAYKNAGDFLIVQRCRELLECEFPDAKIIEYGRMDKLNSYIEEINKSDILIFAGGPAYIKNLYPQKIPLFDNLDDIKIPFFALAMGWKGRTSFPDCIYSYGFSGSTKKLLNRMEKDGFSLGCRDNYSQIVLQNNGINNTLVTGCAAWYDLNYINEIKIINL